MTTQIRPEQRLTILKHLATGKNLDVVATITHIDKDTVADIARHHGYPDVDKLKWAVDVVAKNVEKNRSEIPESTLPQGDPSAPRLRPAPAQAGPSSITHPTATTPEKPDEFRVLINTAKNHDRVRIQKLAEKILDDCAKLRGLIDEEQAAFRARQEAAAEKAAARAEVERLEQALKDARAKLHPAKTTTSTSPSAAAGPAAADIRAWAKDAGVDCPAVGRVPQTVRSAYDDAHQQAAS